MGAVAGGFFKMKKVSEKTVSLVYLAVFSAIIVLLTVTPGIGYIPVGAIRATTVHIPVIVGSILLGPVKGGILGFVFGLTSLATNTLNPTPTSFVFTPFYSIGEFGGSPLSLVVCFVPRILVGVVPYFVCKALRKTGNTMSLIAAGAAGSMTNTLLVMNMIYFFFADTYASAKEIAVETMYKAVILPTIGINGVVEAIVAAIIAVAVVKAMRKVMRMTFVV